MATATAAPPATKRTDPLGIFLTRVQAGTGIDIKVLTAWALQENGPADNPLNIGPGHHYGSPQAAADATVRLLKTDTYKPIIKAAATGSSSDIISAIAHSPWDVCGYRGTNHDGTCVNAPVGSALLGVYTSAYGAPGTTTVTRDAGGNITSEKTTVAGDPVSGAVGQLTDWFSGEASSIGSWITKEAVTGLAYLFLAGGALALIVLGLERSTGGPSALARTITRPGGSEIPF